jgi:hypothetical protein
MNVRIRDLWLVGGGGPLGSQTAVQTAGALLYANNAQKCQFTNLQLTNFHIGIEVRSSTNAEISFVNAYNCYGPAVLRITGTAGNGGGCYVFKNQFDMAPYGFAAPPMAKHGVYSVRRAPRTRPARSARRTAATSSASPAGRARPPGPGRASRRSRGRGARRTGSRTAAGPYAGPSSARRTW